MCSFILNFSSIFCPHASQENSFVSFSGFLANLSATYVSLLQHHFLNQSPSKASPEVLLELPLFLFNHALLVDIPPVNELNETEYHEGAARVVFSFIQRVDQWDIFYAPRSPAWRQVRVKNLE